MKRLAATLAAIAGAIAAGLVLVRRPDPFHICVELPDGGIPGAQTVRVEGRTRVPGPDGGEVLRYFVAEVQEPPDAGSGELRELGKPRFHGRVKPVAAPSHPACWAWVALEGASDAPFDCACGPDCLGPDGGALGLRGVTYEPGRWSMPTSGVCVRKPCRVIAGDQGATMPAECK